ncbi:MAG TPA: BatA domain-containing protein, partial [Gemmatimonadaceae bacterium]|nr:BatA domain-containing protein [Gemmatimonadaceae bacterium]
MTFPTMEFQTPWALALLIFLPLWWLWRRKRSEDAIVFSRTSVLGRGPRAGQGIARAIFFLRNLALAALIVALARPRSGAHVENITSSGINI